ncbi:MAG: GbsR/MarR family transcriptional regulator [Pseudomonadota bacterium]
MNITPTIDTFVQHFGEMGSRWGLNRTAGQICGLLFISENAMNADQIGDALGISRSNVSGGLKELQAWNLLRSVSIQGDRKDYFTTGDDVWEIARTLIDERRRREIDPTFSMLRTALLKEDVGEGNDYAVKRMQEMHDLLELVMGWVNEMQTLNSQRLQTLLKLGSGVAKVLDMTDKLSLRDAPDERSTSVTAQKPS